MSRQGFGFAIGLFVLCGSALADDYTTIYPSANDPNHAQLLASALGGSFSASGLNYSNGSIDAIRKRDNGPMMNTDQIWAAGTYKASLVYNTDDGRSKSFGFISGIGGGTYESLLSTSSIGSMASVTTDEDFRWAIKLNGGKVLSSRNSSNQGTDMMVSYDLYNHAGRLIGAMLLFDDKISAPEKDYADVAVLLTLAPPPQAASLGILGLGGVSVLAGRRRRESVA